MAPSMRQAIIWTNVDPIHWRIYAALGWDDLMQCDQYYFAKDILSKLLDSHEHLSGINVTRAKVFLPIRLLCERLHTVKRRSHVFVNRVTIYASAYTIDVFDQSLPGPTFIKPDQLDPWIKDQLGNALLSTILPLQLWNFVSCGRACPSYMTQTLVTVGTKLLTGE